VTRKAHLRLVEDLEAELARIEQSKLFLPAETQPETGVLSRLVPRDGGFLVLASIALVFSTALFFLSLE
jgi:hypothetical protein